MLSDVSSIRSSIDDNEGIIFDQLPLAAEDNFIEESEQELDDMNGEDFEEDLDPTFEQHSDSNDDKDINFSDNRTR